MDSLLIISAVTLGVTTEIAKAGITIKMRNKGLIE